MIQTGTLNIPQYHTVRLLGNRSGFCRLKGRVQDIAVIFYGSFLFSQQIHHFIQQINNDPVDLPVYGSFYFLPGPFHFFLFLFQLFLHAQRHHQFIQRKRQAFYRTFLSACGPFHRPQLGYEPFPQPV